MTPSSSRPTSGVRILVTEDDPVNLRIARKLLEKLGYATDAVESGAAAITAVSSFSYDLLLLDCQMPGIDGYETAQRLRAAGAALPIIAFTANLVPGDRERCLAAGMNDYLGKPVKLEALANVLRKWLGEKARAA